MMQTDSSFFKAKHVYLECLTEDHRNAIRPLAKNKEIWEFNQMLLIDENYDKMFDEYFNTALDLNAMGGQQTFVIRQSKDQDIIGMTRLYEISPKDKTAMIGYTWYIPTVWGKVHNKECKFLLLSYIFEVLHFNRAELRAAHQNIRSQKAIEKIGAVKEGVLRKHGYRNDGAIRHTVVFSIIDDEWPVAKENLLQLIAESEKD